jgi:hypothetical protein
MRCIDIQRAAISNNLCQCQIFSSMITSSSFRMCECMFEDFANVALLTLEISRILLYILHRNHGFRYREGLICYLKNP